MFDLVFGGSTFQARSLILRQSCNTFKNGLPPSPYVVQYPAKRDSFMLVLDLLDDKAIQVTNDNIFDLMELSKELGFSALWLIIERFKASPDHRLYLQQCNIDTLLSKLETVMDHTTRHTEQIEGLRAEISELRQTTRDDLTSYRENLCTTAIELRSSLTAVQQRISGLESRLSDVSKEKANLSDVRALTDKLSNEGRLVVHVA
jgi:prefoldin subunit 5